MANRKGRWPLRLSAEDREQARLALARAAAGRIGHWSGENRCGGERAEGEEFVENRHLPSKAALSGVAMQKDRPPNRAADRSSQQKADASLGFWFASAARGP